MHSQKSISFDYSCNSIMCIYVLRVNLKYKNTFLVKFSQGNHLVDILYQVNMFRSNECLSCKYERSKRKVRFEEVIDIVKKTKKLICYHPK